MNRTPVRCSYVVQTVVTYIVIQDEQTLYYTLQWHDPSPCFLLSVYLPSFLLWLVGVVICCYCSVLCVHVLLSFVVVVVYEERVVYHSLRWKQVQYYHQW